MELNVPTCNSMIACLFVCLFLLHDKVIAGQVERPRIYIRMCLSPLEIESRKIKRSVPLGKSKCGLKKDLALNPLPKINI